MVSVWHGAKSVQTIRNYLLSIAGMIRLGFGWSSCNPSRKSALWRDVGEGGGEMDSLQVICTLLYVLDLALLTTYVVYVFRKYGYIISLFNIGLFQFYVTILISPIYFFSNESLAALLIESADLMRPFSSRACLSTMGVPPYLWQCSLYAYGVWGTDGLPAHFPAASQMV
jgi:hypothetical protein